MQYGSSFGIVDGALAPASARSGVVLRKVAGDVGDAPDWLVEQNERFAGQQTDTTPAQDAPARAVDLEARVLATSGPTLSNRAALPPVAIVDAEALETILSTLGDTRRDELTVDFAEEVVLGFQYRGDCGFAARATFQRGDGYRAYPAPTLSEDCDAVFHERYVLVAVPRMHDEPTRAHLFGAVDGWDPTVVSVVPVG